MKIITRLHNLQRSKLKNSELLKRHSWKTVKDHFTPLEPKKSDQDPASSTADILATNMGQKSSVSEFQALEM